MATKDIYLGHISHNRFIGDYSKMLTESGTIERALIPGEGHVIPPAAHLSGYAFSPRVSFQPGSGLGGSMLDFIFQDGADEGAQDPQWVAGRNYTVMAFPIGSMKQGLWLRNDISVPGLVLEFYLANGVPATQDGAPLLVYDDIHGKEVAVIEVDQDPLNWVKVNQDPGTGFDMENNVGNFTLLHNFHLDPSNIPTENWTKNYPFVIMVATAVPVWSDYCASNTSMFFSLMAQYFGINYQEPILTDCDLNIYSTGYYGKGVIPSPYYKGNVEPPPIQ